MNPDGTVALRREEVHLSTLLTDLVDEADGQLSLQDIVDRTGDRGGFLLLIFLCLPFTTPVPLPGVSTVIGIVIAWIALTCLGTSTPRLPAWLGRRTVSAERQKQVLLVSRPFVCWIEKAVRPRGGAWLTGMVGRRVHALLLTLLALLLLLPLPVPFTNSLPAYAIILLSACLMERDARLIFVGYALSLVASMYVGAALIGGAALIQAAWAWLVSGAARST